jgi:hypothetical protein
VATGEEIVVAAGVAVAGGVAETALEGAVPDGWPPTRPHAANTAAANANVITRRNCAPRLFMA